MSFLPIFDRPNSIGEINCFLRRVVLQNGKSLLTGAESRVTLILLEAQRFLVSKLKRMLAIQGSNAWQTGITEPGSDITKENFLFAACPTSENVSLELNCKTILGVEHR